MTADPAAYGQVPRYSPDAATWRAGDVSGLLPGSVVVATATKDGRTERRTFMRMPEHEDFYAPLGLPWRAHQDIRDRAWFASADLTDAVIVYDASRAAEYDRLRAASEALARVVTLQPAPHAMLCREPDGRCFRPSCSCHCHAYPAGVVSFADLKRAFWPPTGTASVEDLP